MVEFAGAPPERVSQTDIVVAGIRRMIVEGGLAPGARLPVESDLAESLGVSRGSLREGVRALVMMGVLQVRQGAGTFVSALDSDLLLAPIEFVLELHSGDVRTDVHAVRRVLEVEACGLAATRIDEVGLQRADEVLSRVDRLLADGTFDDAAGLAADVEFHRLVAGYCDNSILRALIEALSSKTLGARMWRASHETDVSRSTQREHRAILDALREHDVQRARLRMHVHLLEVEDYIRSAPPGAEPPATP